MKTGKWSSAYLNADTLRRIGTQLVYIDNVTEETIAGESKLVLYGLISTHCIALNVTAIRLLETWFGDDTDSWLGKYIVAYVDETVTFGGRRCGGVALRLPKAGFTPPPAPTPAPTPPASPQVPPPQIPPIDDKDIPF